jgi:adenine-specific DNA-methyltransferase
LENFDAEVHDKLRISLAASQEYLNRYERLLMQLTEYELGAGAEFVEDKCAFLLRANPFPAVSDIPLGRYELPRRSGEAHFYRLAHPLAVQIVEQAKQRQLRSSEITLDFSGSMPKAASLRPFVGQIGDLSVVLLTINSLDQAEDYLLVSAISDGGERLDDDAARRLFSLAALTVADLPEHIPNPLLQEAMKAQAAHVQNLIASRNAEVFEAEADKLDNWADDLKVALEREIKDFDRQIKEAKRAATLSLTLQEKLSGQKQIKAIESQRNSRRRSLFDAQDEIDKRREGLIAAIEQKLAQKTTTELVVSLRWRLL